MVEFKREKYSSEDRKEYTADMRYPLISNNVTREDVDYLIEFLKTSDRFTNGSKVREFEDAWSEWLGVKYSLFVNSGASANFLTLAGIKELYGDGEVIVSPIGWESDVACIIRAGLTPVFVDVNMHNLSANLEEVKRKITPKTRAILLIHVLGYNALSRELIDLCAERDIKIIEDVCESHGAVFIEDNKRIKCGTVGYASNFSFYYAHHMSTIEGGMVCTNDNRFYQYMRMLRSHGMSREMTDETIRNEFIQANPGVHEEFLFPVPGYNMRSTELNAVIGLSQIKRLDNNIELRRSHYDLFIKNLDADRFYTEFDHEGSSNYSFVVILREKDKKLFERITTKLREAEIEFRRGTAGGGNQIRQPYVKRYVPEVNAADYIVAEHIHEYGLYVGNYPDLKDEKILELCDILNNA